MIAPRIALALVAVLGTAVLGQTEEAPAAAGETGQAAPALEESSPALTASIIFAEDVDGEVAVFDARGELVTRVFKSEGHPFVLRLEPGRYQVEWRTKPRLQSTNVFVGEGEEIVMDRRHLINEGCCAPEERPRPKGPKPGELNLRPWRLTFDGGMWSSSTSDLPSVTIEDGTLTSEGGGFMGGLSVGYRVTPEWMVDLRMENRILEVTELHSGHHWHHGCESASMIMAFSLGARYYIPPMATQSAVKPYVRAGVGPTLAVETEGSSGWWDDSYHGWDGHGWTRTMAAFGGQVGGGVDIQASSWIVFGADVAYHFSSNFSEPLLGHKNGNGLTFAFQLGVNLGGRMREGAR